MKLSRFDEIRENYATAKMFCVTVVFVLSSPVYGVHGADGDDGELDSFWGGDELHLGDDRTVEELLDLVHDEVGHGAHRHHDRQAPEELVIPSRRQVPLAQAADVRAEMKRERLPSILQ